MNKRNLIISKFEELKKFYQQSSDKKWKLRALLTAINSIQEYEGDITSGSQLQTKIKGIGEKFAIRIDEILKTGTLQELNLINDTSKYLDNMLLITGIGLVKAKKWVDLGLKDINDVRQAIKDKKITTTHHIDIGIKYFEDFLTKIPRDEIDNIKIFLNNILKKIDNKIIFEICGSYRRGALESGDIDILITNPDNNDKTLLTSIVKTLKKNNFIIDDLTSKGTTKFMGVCKLPQNKIARRIDIRVIEFNSYFTSLLYFTGSKKFNLYLRNKALENNYTLNEYSLTNLTTGESISLNSEEEIFKIFNIPYLKPEER